VHLFCQACHAKAAKPARNLQTSSIHYRHSQSESNRYGYQEGVSEKKWGTPLPLMPSGNLTFPSVDLRGVWAVGRWRAL